MTGLKARLKDWRRGMYEQLDAMSLWLWRWDHRCLEAICSQPRLRRVSRLFIVATYLGDGYLWLLAVIGLFVFGTALDRRRIAVMLLVTICNILLFRLSKRVTKRGRPDSPAAWAMRFRYLDSYSFPSGHATTSFGMAYMLSVFYPYWPVQLASFSAAALIAFSRVYVGEHYPSDVLIGALLGVLASGLLLPPFGVLLLA